MNAVSAVGAQYQPAVVNAALAAIEAARVEGDISDHGYGEPNERGRYRTGVRVSAQHFNVDEVATSLLYLVAGPVVILPRMPRGGGDSSYYLKHQAEDWGRLVGFAPYVSNGALIVAADWLGVPSRRYQGSPNIEYGVKVPKTFGYSSGDEAFDTRTCCPRSARYSQARALCKVVAR
jgi:hypothetical protein